MPSLTRFFHPVLAARALRRGAVVRVQIAGDAYALFRGADGKPAALVDRCPHRFAPLSAGTVRPDGRLACAYHGWHFGADGRGVSPSQPALKHCDVRAMQVVEQHGYLWLADASADPSRIASIDPDEPGYERAGAFCVQMPASLEHTLDIFADAEHPAWVHGRIAWDRTGVDRISFEHARYADRSEVRTSGPQRFTWMTRALGVRKTDTFHNHWVTRFDPVRTSFKVFWTRPDQTTTPLETHLMLFMVPETERTTMLHGFVSTRMHGALRGVAHGVLKRLTVSAARNEILEDVRFLRHMNEVPTSLEGARLGRLDAAITHNRRLLERVYYGVEATEARTNHARRPVLHVV